MTRWRTAITSFVFAVGVMTVILGGSVAVTLTLRHFGVTSLWAYIPFGVLWGVLVAWALIAFVVRETSK